MIHPGSIAFRIALAMLGLIVLMTVSFGVLRFYDDHDNDGPTAYVAHRIATIADIVDAVPRRDRPAFVAALHNAVFTVDVGDAPAPGLTPLSGLSIWVLRQQIEAGLKQPLRRTAVGSVPAPGSSAGSAEDPGVQATQSGTSPKPIVIQVPLSDGQWLRFDIAKPEGVGGFPYGRFAERICLTALLVWLFSIWTARRLAAPIAAFAEAAERFGKDTDATPLVESGPRELRIAMRAFNQMQERLQRFVRDRTQMLAAMSHDLRTPLTRLTLRSESIEDPKEKRKMLADLEEMIAMIESSLTFAREDFNREARTLVDLRALVENICEDAADTKAVVSCNVAERIDLECRPQALRRAITNLVDNALKYGGAAYVTVLRETGRVLILVDDDGPGIPTEQQEKVFAPFYRLESSRNRETGGAGLGLALVRTIAHGHGGKVSLANRIEKGLRVRLELPA